MNEPTSDDPNRARAPDRLDADAPDASLDPGRTGSADVPDTLDDTVIRTESDIDSGTSRDIERLRLREREAQLRAYARLLDSAVRLPGGFRIGLDGIVGLVPIVGDLAGLGLSSYLVVAAARLGVRRSVIARMAGNVALESAIGIVPIVGDAFDFVFKANERNVRLLERELAARVSGSASASASESMSIPDGDGPER